LRSASWPSDDKLNDELSTSETYKGVAIFAGQPKRRVALVKKEIDRVSKISDPVRLSEIAADCSWSPEARIYSAALCRAALQRATERREAKPDIDAERVEGSVAGLASRRWANPHYYCSDLDSHPERAVPREQPLPDDA
jgi:hypothetical protein